MTHNFDDFLGNTEEVDVEKLVARMKVQANIMSAVLELTSTEVEHAIRGVISTTIDVTRKVDGKKLTKHDINIIKQWYRQANHRDCGDENQSSDCYKVLDKLIEMSEEET